MKEGEGEGGEGGVEGWVSVKETCLKAITKTRTHQQEGKLKIEYLPGNGLFKCKCKRSLILYFLFAFIHVIMYYSV
jgi:hypothetical protein